MRVIIAEDQNMLRGALSALLGMEDDIEVIGQAENGEQALQMIVELSPDICIMDIEMPKLTGLDVAERLKEQGHQSCTFYFVMGGGESTDGAGAGGTEAGSRGSIGK
jgi:YesN/AraC family two-component response regulator